MAKEECAKECNLVMECYYATLYYNETTTVEECTLVTKDCGDWVNYENQLGRYFYQKGISFKFMLCRKSFKYLTIKLLQVFSLSVSLISKLYLYRQIVTKQILTLKILMLMLTMIGRYRRMKSYEYPPARNCAKAKRNASISLSRTTPAT